MAKKSKKSTLTEVEQPKPVLDIGKDIKDYHKYPWPKANESVYELVCNDVLEFVPGKQRDKFMDEVYRILVTGGKAVFNVRYWNTDSAIQDYMYEWPPLCEKSFLYFNKGWREANNLKRDIKCDFDFTYGYSVEPNTAARSEEVRSFNIKHYNNTVLVLQVVLIKR
jgi:hypothetical protein